MHDEMLDGQEVAARTLDAWKRYGKATAPKTRLKWNWANIAATLSVAWLAGLFVVSAFFLA